MKHLLAFAARAFFGGCIGAFGALASLLFLAFLVWIAPGSSPIDEYLARRASKGALPSTPLPTPTGELPGIRLWITLSDDPAAPALAQLTPAQLLEARVWAAVDSVDEVPFQIWLDGPMGRGEWGPPERSRPGGEPFLAGRFATAMLPGHYSLEAHIGETVMGRLAFELVDGG